MTAELREAYPPPLHERPPTYRYGDIIAPHIGADEPLALQDKHFIASVCQQTDPETSGSSGAAIVAVLEAIEKSLHTRMQIAIESI